MITVDTSQLKGVSNRIKHLAKMLQEITADPSFQRSVGQLLVARGKTNLEERGANGRSYALLAPSTKRTKMRRGQSLKPLQGEGLLKRSLSFQPNGSKLTLRAVDYAVHHQFGAPKGNLPARPIFTIDKEDEEDIKDFLIRRFQQKTTL